jgi:flagellar motor switch protein FliG
MARVTAIGTRVNALSGPEKVAIILLSVGRDHAARVMEQFGEEEQRDVVRAMAGMGLVSAEVVEKLLHAFVEHIDNPSVFGSLAQAEQILLKVMPADKARQILEDLRGVGGRTTWEKMQSVPDGQIAAFLRSESPQTASFVVTKLPAGQAARILQQLPQPLAEEIVKRIINMTPVAKPILDDVERILRSEFLVNVGQNRTTDNHAVVAELFNHLDRELEEGIFAVLDRDMPESAEQVRSLMFTFNDIADIDDAGIQILMRDIPNGLLPLALKGAKAEMQDVFLRNMAERAARMMREEIENMPKVRARDVEDARRQIIAICKELIAKGDIATAGEDDGDWVT